MERNIGRGNNEFGDRLPSALRPKSGARSYVDRSEGSKASYIDLLVGESPYGPPKEFKQILKNLYDSGKLYESMIHYMDVDIREGIQDVRDRFGLSQVPHIEFGAGSDEMIERLPTLFASYPVVTHVYGIAPCFPDIVKFINKYKDAENPEGSNIKYNPIKPPLIATADEAIDLAIETRVNSTKNLRNVVHYVDRPNPKGDVATLGKITEMAIAAARKNDLVVIDEAGADTISDEESGVKLAEFLPNVFVLRSISKIPGLPGLRIGYAVMSPKIGDLYKSVRRDYDIPGPQQLIINSVLKPDIIKPHNEEIRQKIRGVKNELIKRIGQIENVQVLPTHPDTQHFMLKGNSSTFYENLDFAGLKTAPGAGFYDTYGEGMDNSVVRIIVPKDLSQAAQIARKIRASTMVGAWQH